MKKPRERLARVLSWRRREDDDDLEAIAAREQRVFRYEKLEAATRRFADKNRLGQGRFGPVYRGRLEDGREAAVKLLRARSRQGAKDFRNEATLLTRVQHRNVVKVIGHCTRGADDKLLVYEYVPESLDKILFSSSPGNRGSHSNGDLSRRAELTWPRRHVVVVGVARGLVYLHEDGHTPIIHRAIKPSNILLDDWVPKIADFGMARLFPHPRPRLRHQRLHGARVPHARQALHQGRRVQLRCCRLGDCLRRQELQLRPATGFQSQKPPRIRVETVQEGAEPGAA